jgi:hypothetical protein
MNSRDKANLQFLMSVSNREFDEWLSSASSDDVDYALELIRKNKVEKLLEQIELEEVMYSCDDDMTEANEILSRFKLK